MTNYKYIYIFFFKFDKKIPLADWIFDIFSPVFYHNLPYFIHSACNNQKDLSVTYEWQESLIFLKKTRQIWGIWKLRPAYSSEMPNLGQNRWCFVPCDLEVPWMTLENNRASLLCCFKLCATFHSHWWIQTGVTVRKRPIWVKFDNF